MQDNIFGINAQTSRGREKQMEIVLAIQNDQLKRGKIKFTRESHIKQSLRNKRLQ
jgi:hypothetical protein